MRDQKLGLRNLRFFLAVTFLVSGIGYWAAPSLVGGKTLPHKKTVKIPKKNAGSSLTSATSKKATGQNNLMSATQKMQETQMSYNLQYLQLQNSTQNENKQFTTVSNIEKTKHDTTKNTISNVH